MHNYLNLVEGDKRILKPSLYNFGASKIFVISDKDNIERRKAFDEAWSHYSDFDYQYVDAVMGKDISVTKFIEDDKIDYKFLCPNGCLSRNILGVYQSHLKIWNLIKSDTTLRQDDFVLILEDDARPSNYFLSEAFQSGEFRNILDWLYKHKPHGFYWGRADERIRGSITNEFINKPDLTLSYGAHAYMLNCNLIDTLIHNGSIQNMAADVFIDYEFETNIKGMYSPYYSFIRQESHILGQQWFSDDDVNRMYGSTTQPEWNGSDIDARDFEGIYENVTSEMEEYISDARYIKDMNFGPHDWIELQFKDLSELLKNTKLL